MFGKKHIDEQAEKRAQESGWTYESGYKQGRGMGRSAQGNNNYFPRFTNAWWGHKQGYEDGKEERESGWGRSF